MEIVLTVTRPQSCRLPGLTIHIQVVLDKSMVYLLMRPRMSTFQFLLQSVVTNLLI